MRLGQNWLLMKNLQFSHNYLETLSKGPPHEKSMVTKFQQDLIKSIDFSLVDNFWPSVIFYAKVSKNLYFEEFFYKFSYNLFFTPILVILPSNIPNTYMLYIKLTLKVAIFWRKYTLRTPFSLRVPAGEQRC